MNRVLIAAAGSGKTTSIVREILGKESAVPIAIITYTLNNVGEIRRKFFEENGFVPDNVNIYPWFTFLLGDFVRPYQNFVYDKNRIESISFVNGRSAQWVKKTDVQRYYLSDGKNIYTDKIAEFACLCDKASNGKVIERLSSRYRMIYIDEVQDLAGYDLELVEVLFRSGIEISLIGDSRQATYQTNHSHKNVQYAGAQIVDKFKVWEKLGLCSIDYLTDSYRCSQAICDIADSIYPQLPRTNSKNTHCTGHDGVFTVSKSQLNDYISRYQPQVLRFDRKTKSGDHHALNFGESKGLTFRRVLILPNGPIKELLRTGDFGPISGTPTSAAKLYVALTRAEQSVAIVFDGEANIAGIESYQG